MSLLLLQNDPGSVASYQPAPLANPSPFQTGTQGYCNASSAMPGYGVPSNTPYCTSSQPTWSSYRCDMTARVYCENERAHSQHSRLFERLAE